MTRLLVLFNPSANHFKEYFYILCVSDLQADFYSTISIISYYNMLINFSYFLLVINYTALISYYFIPLFSWCSCAPAPHPFYLYSIFYVLLYSVTICSGKAQFPDRDHLVSPSCVSGDSMLHLLVEFTAPWLAGFDFLPPNNAVSGSKPR